MKKTSILLCAMLIAGIEAQSQDNFHQGLSANQIADSILDSNAEFGIFDRHAQHQNNMHYLSKSASDLVLKLDSITSPGNYRVEYNYNNEGNVILSTQYVYNPQTSMYVPGMKREFSYDDNMYLINLLRQQWNPLADGWDNQELEEFEFDNDGNELVSQSSYWSVLDDEWIATQRTEQTYDEEGRLSERIQFAEDPGPGSALVPQLKRTYIYDNEGILDETITEFREENDMGDEVWVPGLQNLYSYENGLQDTVFINAWSPDDEEWQISRIRTFTYDGGLEVMSRNKTWNPTEEVWIETGKIEREYTSSGLETSTTHFIMEEDGWRPVFTIENVWGAGDNAEQLNFYIWSQELQELYLSSSSQYSFDLDFEIDELAMPQSYKNTPRFKNKPESRFGTGYLPSGFVISQIEDEYHYSPFTTLSTSNKQDPKLRLYPNPASDFVNISSQHQTSPVRLEIFDTQGRRVMDMITQPNAQISVAGMPKGLYIYRLNGGGEIQNTGKLVKQ